jgi:hypothetical protein
MLDYPRQQQDLIQDGSSTKPISKDDKESENKQIGVSI